MAQLWLPRMHAHLSTQTVPPICNFTLEWQRQVSCEWCIEHIRYLTMSAWIPSKANCICIPQQLLNCSCKHDCDTHHKTATGPSLHESLICALQVAQQRPHRGEDNLSMALCLPGSWVHIFSNASMVARVDASRDALSNFSPSSISNLRAMFQGNDVWSAAVIVYGHLFNQRPFLFLMGNDSVRKLEPFVMCFEAIAAGTGTRSFALSTTIGQRYGQAIFPIAFLWTYHITCRKCFVGRSPVRQRWSLLESNAVRNKHRTFSLFWLYVDWID